jgi:hypothetical protein
MKLKGIIFDISFFQIYNYVIIELKFVNIKNG